MGRQAGLLVALVSGAGILSAPWSGAAEKAAYRRLAGKRDEAVSVRAAVDGARQRLGQQGCAGLLDEFRDATGRTLRANLDALGLTPGEYMDRIIFFDAEGAGRCRSTIVLAMTTPGSRAVIVCGARFAKTRRYDPRLAEATIIHEALHTLGLEENPPSSSQITSRVLARCGR